jgi:hypothetical protein
MNYNKRRKKNNKQTERFKVKYQKKETGIMDSYGLRKQGGYENGRERIIIILNNAQRLCLCAHRLPWLINNQTFRPQNECLECHSLDSENAYFDNYC